MFSNFQIYPLYLMHRLNGIKITIEIDLNFLVNVSVFLVCIRKPKILTIEKIVKYMSKVMDKWERTKLSKMYTKSVGVSKVNWVKRIMNILHYFASHSPPPSLNIDLFLSKQLHLCNSDWNDLISRYTRFMLNY